MKSNSYVVDNENDILWDDYLDVVNLSSQYDGMVTVQYTDPDNFKIMVKCIPSDKYHELFVSKNAVDSLRRSIGLGNASIRNSGKTTDLCDTGYNLEETKINALEKLDKWLVTEINKTIFIGGGHWNICDETICKNILRLKLSEGLEYYPFYLIDDLGNMLSNKTSIRSLNNIVNSISKKKLELEENYLAYKNEIDGSMTDNDVVKVVGKFCKPIPPKKPEGPKPTYTYR